MKEPPGEEPSIDEFAATSRDREAMSFEDVAAKPDPEPKVAEGEPEWVGAIAAEEPAPPSPAPVAPVAAAELPGPEPVAPPVDPLDLASTNRQQKAFEPSEEPALDQLAEDARVVEAGRAAGWTRGATAPTAQDTALKVGLGVIVLLIALTVLGVCAGVGASWMAGADEPAAFEE